MSVDHEYLGNGIYSIPEASHLTGISPSQIRRWILGYADKRTLTARSHDSVFHADYAPIEHHVSLSFLDLIEIQFIRSFRRHGVSWKSIRIAASKAADLLQFGHPFTRKDFFTDGRHILTRIAHDSGDLELLNLVDDQFEINDIVSPILYENLDFGEIDVANRWWPRGRQSGVVIDPKRNLGKPIVDRHNIPTAVLAELFRTVNSADEVADWYEIDPQSVVRAVEFETALAA